MTEQVNKPATENGQPLPTLSQELARILREAYFPPMRERTLDDRLLGFRVMARLLAQQFGKRNHKSGNPTSGQPPSL